MWQFKRRWHKIRRELLVKLIEEIESERCYLRPRFHQILGSKRAKKSRRQAQREKRRRASLGDVGESRKRKAEDEGVQPDPGAPHKLSKV
jgi:hypothetical protein